MPAPSSPMALSSSPSPRSSFTGPIKRTSSSSSSKSSPSRDAASLLAAVRHADALARERTPSPAVPTSTPALSMSSSVTRDSDGSTIQTYDEDSDGLKLKVYGDDEHDEPLLLHPSTAPTSEQAPQDTRHTEFGHCWNDAYRHESAHPRGEPLQHPKEMEPPYYILLSTYLSYMLLIMIGHVRDFVGKRGKRADYLHLMPHDGYAPLNSDFDSFYTRRLKERINDCFSQPVTGVAGRTIMLLDRTSTDNNRTLPFTGTRTRALNISSYNYLGFAQARGGCADVVEECIRRYGVASCGSRREGGTLDLHNTAEALVANFVGTEDASIVSMGFATNSTIIPALVGKGCLVISDELNHASIRVGVRFSGASVRMFPHNNMKKLEGLLREVISQGQPRTHRPWKKILLIVEGLYSMEGTLANLPAILELKKKYKFNLFVDEAHSIGALGPHGRGVCDYFGIDPRSIDILMGTFTKSFGAAGGYVAGSRQVVQKIRLRATSGPYAEAMAPAVLMQVVASMASIMGVSPPLPVNYEDVVASSTSTSMEVVKAVHPGPAPASLLPAWCTLPPALADGSEGKNRLRRLAFNARYLHAGLHALGFITYGSADSPIVPLLVFHPAKLAMFHRFMKQRKVPIVVVVVAYPATPLISGRVRFCVSAAHTKEDVDEVLRACDEIGSTIDLKHGIPVGERWGIERVIRGAEELVREGRVA